MPKKLTLISCLAFLLAVCACAPSIKDSEEPVEVIKVDGLKEILSSKKEDIQVINFWATWCAPCVKEMPYFERLNAEMDDQLDVTFISLNFLDEMQDKVVPFLEKNGYKSKVVLIDEVDYNLWIDIVDPSWSGAIPATLIVNTNTGQRKFLEKELHDGEIEEILKEFLN